MATLNQVISYECPACGWITKNIHDTCVRCGVTFNRECVSTAEQFIRSKDNVLGEGWSDDTDALTKALDEYVALKIEELKMLHVAALPTKEELWDHLTGMPIPPTDVLLSDKLQRHYIEAAYDFICNYHR